jgi:hypothetical protein
MAKRTLNTGKSSPSRTKQAKKSLKKATAGKPPAKMARTAPKRAKDPLPGGDPFEL